MPDFPIENFVPNWSAVEDKDQQPSEEELKKRRSKMVTALMGSAVKIYKKSITKPRQK